MEPVWFFLWKVKECLLFFQCNQTPENQTLAAKGRTEATVQNRSAFFRDFV